MDVSITEALNIQENNEDELEPREGEDSTEEPKGTEETGEIEPTKDEAFAEGENSDHFDGWVERQVLLGLKPGEVFDPAKVGHRFVTILETE